MATVSLGLAPDITTAAETLGPAEVHTTTEIFVPLFPRIGEMMNGSDLNQTLSGDCPPQSDDPAAPFKLFNFILIMAVTVVGLVGNLLVILTFHRQKRQTSATTFLKTLAAFDIMLIIATNLFSHRYAYTLVFPREWVSQFQAGKLTIGILPIGYICQSLSTWTVVAVALDRYIHVCYPLKASKWCKIRTAQRMVSGIVLTSVIYNIPRFFEYYKILQVAEDAIDPCTGYFYTPEGTLGNNDIYKYTYAFGLYMTFMYAVPLGSLIFFNGNLIRKLQSMKVPGSDGKVEKLKGSDKILPSLIGVVSIFLVCQIPDMVLQILWRINSPFAPTFSIIAYDFIIINSSANFIIYVVAANGFRKSLMDNVLPCLQCGSSEEDFTTEHTQDSNSKFSVSKFKSQQLKEVDSEKAESKDSGIALEKNNFRQEYRNPEPVEEDDESTSPCDVTIPATPSPQSLKADVWIGGKENSGFTAVDQDVAPSFDGLSDAYRIRQDPLIQNSVNSQLSAHQSADTAATSYSDGQVADMKF